MKSDSPGLSEQEEARITRIEDELREGIASLRDVGAAVSLLSA